MDFRKYLVVFLILFLIGAIFGLFGTAINNMQKISEPENTGNPEELLYLSNNVTLERETYEFFGCLSGVNVVSGDILECIRGGNYSGTENKYLQVKYLKDECGGYGTVVETCDEGKVCIEVPFQYNGLLIRDYTLMNGTNFRYRVECIDPPQDIGEIKNLIHNGDLDEKLNLLVVNIDFDEEAFLEIMNVTLFGDSPYSEYDVGFFELSPFYENQNKFNVDYVSEIPVDFLECMGDGTEGRGFHIFSSFQCNIDRLRNLYSDYDFIAVFGKYIKTHAMENSIYISNKSNSVSLGQAFSHEFAHMFGLVEEYQYYTELYCPTGEPPCFTVVSVFDFDTSSSGFAAVPNLDKVGCPKW